MSKYVKDLVSKEIAHRLEGVGYALLVNVVGLDAGKTFVLRRRLREKNIELLVIKNSLGRRATEDTPLAAAFQGVEGTLAMVWGSEDFVSLTKEITSLDGSAEFPNLSDSRRGDGRRARECGSRQGCQLVAQPPGADPDPAGPDSVAGS